MNIFDNLQVAAFNTVTQVMGYDCTWLPSAGGSLKSARVLYKSPTEKEREANVEFDIDTVYMEYKEGDLVGLKESADQNNRERVFINEKEHVVLTVSKKFDGKDYQAILKPL